MNNNRTLKTNEQRRAACNDRNPQPMERQTVRERSWELVRIKMSILANTIAAAWNQHPGMVVRVEHQGEKIRMFNNVGSRLVLVPKVIA